MRSSLSLITIVCLITIGCSSGSDYRLPAEWEPQSGIVVGDSIPSELQTEIVKGPNIFKGNNPIVVVNKKGEQQIVVFNNNYPFDTISSEFKFPIIKSPMVHSRRAMETNGKGTFLLVEALNIYYNPEMGRDQQEEELKRTLGAKKIIWLKEGLTDNALTGGQIDLFCRFINERTILLAMPDSMDMVNDPSKRMTKLRMTMNYEILKKATDDDGNTFDIVLMPEGYLNFLITDKTIYLSKYGNEKDERAKGIISKYYPDRKVYQINSGEIHRWTTPLH